MANGYVRYGNSIHLDGFQILDFCIENAISLESLSDRNLGRKVFLTGNDTNEGYLRENVWDGTRWRAAAYLDDLTSFKDEDFQQLKDKVDTLIGDGVDMDGIIESWKEVEAFLAGMSDTKTLMTMLDGKVDHVINMDSSAYKTLGYGRPDEGWRYYGAAISFGTNTYFAQIQVNYQADQIVFRRHTNQGFSEWQTLIHSGNALDQLKGTFLPLTGGTINGTGVNPLNVNTTNESEVGLYFNQNNTSKAWVGYSASGGAGIYDVATKSTLGITIEGVPHFNKKTLLHEGNVGEYTAGAANRLANKVSLWGNEFDGTQSLGGRIAFSKGFAAMYVPIEDGGSNIEFLYVNPEGHLLLGQGLARNEKNTLIYGNNIKFCYGTLGTSANTAMTITEEGQVRVGNVTTSLTNVISYIGGRQHIYSTDETVTLGNAPTRGLTIGYDTRGLAQWINNGGNIQSMRFDSATAYALNLNPLGGAVNVGGNLAPNANNSLSLGTSSYRWSDVYSVGGNFSGRVLIGGAEDDGESALQVKGDVRLGSVTAIETYISSESNGYLGLLSTGNEMIIEGKTNSDININYRRSKRGYAPKTWNWLAGSSTEYADFVLGHATFNGGALIPTGQKLTIGDANGDHATIEYDSIAKAIKVDGNLFTTGTLASGGKAKEGTGTGSGSANVRDFELPADRKTTYDCDHLLKSKNVIVQVFEKAIQNNIEVWEMILTDVTIVTEDRVTVTFGRPTTKVHKVHIIGGNVS